MLNRHKNWLVHKQTACGKDFSNPFKVDNLPKIVRFSTHLASLVKSWLVQDQTVLGKDYSNLLIADSLLKTIWFINAPCYGNEALAMSKSKRYLIQTTTGKRNITSIMAVSWPKTTKPTYLGLFALVLLRRQSAAEKKIVVYKDQDMFKVIWIHPL
ncbi:hypothetical protein Tco_1312947 [Tanacetum coccineum]